MNNYISKKITGDFDVISKSIHASLVTEGFEEIDELNIQNKMAELFGAQIGRFKVFEINNLLNTESIIPINNNCNPSLQSKIIVQELANNIILVLTANTNYTDFETKKVNSNMNFLNDQEKLKLIIASLKNQY